MLAIPRFAFLPSLPVHFVLVILVILVTVSSVTPFPHVLQKAVAPTHPKLRVDMMDMDLDCPDAHLEGARDLVVVKLACQMAHDLQLPRCEALRQLRFHPLPLRE